MKISIFENWAFTAVGFVICLISVLAMPRLAICGSQGDDGEIEELRLRANAEVEDVNKAAGTEIADAEAVRRNRYLEELGYVPEGNLLSNDELAAIKKQRAEKEKTIRARFGYDINSLKQEEAGISESSTAEIRPYASARPVVLGTVTGIVLYNDKGAALIAGEVVRENDTVLGVKVVRIMNDYVEFEQQGKTWKQEVGQPPPASVWVKPEKRSRTSKPKPGR
ncbi:MAG: hypothetical protein ABII09_00070 [Planctomycetota bacterium]